MYQQMQKGRASVGCAAELPPADQHTACSEYFNTDNVMHGTLVPDINPYAEIDMIVDSDKSARKIVQKVLQKSASMPKFRQS